ncbi:hypothetical protein VTK73DRAFT_3221 [Phialemonium thermophilum]|uniref:Yeast cell wall synthesis Kre9/Knh1-like N-terminal domain-containing protein n=1 Tax=Phialemonium thermophilum TaxID=223376 RepID=A0ABR3Y7H6_9PEZI
MRFSITASLVAFASVVLAQTPNFDPISKPADHEVIPAGTNYQIVWEPSTKYTGPVTITLLGGTAANTLTDVAVLAKGLPNSAGTFQWAVDAALGKQKTYGLRISLDSNPSIFQYSFPFSIKGSAAGPTSGSTSATSSATGSISLSASTSSGATGSGYPTSSVANSTSASATSATSYTQTTKSAYPTTKAPGNSTTSTALPGKTVITLTTTPSAPSGSATAAPSPSASIVPNPAGTIQASSLALLGGLAMAIFAL